MHDEKVFGEHSYEVLTSSREGLQRQSDHFGTEQRHDTDGYNIIPLGYCTYRNRSDDGIFTFNVNNAFHNGIVSKFYPVFKFVGANSTFMTEYLNNSISNKKKLSILAVGTSQVVLSISALRSSSFCIPHEKEQDKLASFIELLNTRIVIQRKLVEHLKKYKRGVISKLFSREIRFTKKDGSSFPEWREYPLDSVVEFLDGQRKPLESAERANRKGSYPYYGASGIIDYIDNYIFDEPLLLLGEDGANIITRSSPLCFIATGKYWVNNHAHVMRPKQGFDLRFVCEALESIDYTKYNTGTAQPKLNQEKCRQILFTYPCYEEQQCISSFLSSITKRIMNSEEQLSLLETQKKSLLQQLFI